MVIFVIGYPKSGLTWLTRLMGDILNCPTGGFIAANDKEEIASEGFDRPNKEFIVRKGHYNPVRSWSGTMVKKDLTLNVPAAVQNHLIIHIVRDPRDIVVSGAHHWNVSHEQFAKWMITGTNGVRALGRWDKYVNSWNSEDVTVMTYERLHKHGVASLKMLCNKISGFKDLGRIAEAYERQSFENRIADIQKNGDKYPLGKEFNLRFMRRGQPGCWKDELSKAIASQIFDEFGGTMWRFGYD